MRGEGSLYGAIVVAIIFSIAVSTLYSYMTSLNKAAGDIYSSLSSVMGDLGASVYFTPTASSLYIYSDRSLAVVGVFVYSPSGLLYSRVSSGEPIANVSPSSPLDLLSIVPQSLITQILSGGAFLGVLMSNGVLYTYRYIDQGSANSGVVNNDIWSLGLLAIARSMSDIGYTSPGIYWFSGDEASGSIRVTIARSISIAEGVVLYTADPRETWNYVPTSTGAVIIYSIGARGGSGVTRIIVADTIIVNGTITSRGLGGPSNIMYAQTNYYGNPIRCGDWVDYKPAGAGTVASGGGGGSGAYTDSRLICRGLMGGSASLYGYTASGGMPGGYYSGKPEQGYPGSVLDERALIKLLTLSPQQIANNSLFGAGGGGGGSGDGYGYMFLPGGKGGRGGGGLVILCNRLIMNKGVIDASGEDGNPAESPNGGGGGGGGSGGIIIICNSIEGSGFIKARGGSGGSGKGIGMPGGGGGDGWIVIMTNKISPYIGVDAGSGFKIIAMPPRVSG